VTRHRPSLPGVPRDRFPRFVGTMGCSDFLPPVAPHFGRPSSGATIGAALVRSHAHGPQRAWAWRRSRRPPAPVSVEATGSPRFLGSPCSRAVPSDPAGPTCPRSDPVLRSRQVSAAFRYANTVGPRTGHFRGSITRPIRSLSTLRGPGRPGSFHARLATGLLTLLDRAGLSPAGLLPRLSGSHQPPSCRARLGLAHWRFGVQTRGLGP
jgi:hypothetical protein